MNWDDGYWSYNGGLEARRLWLNAQALIKFFFILYPWGSHCHST